MRESEILTGPLRIADQRLIKVSLRTLFRRSTPASFLLKRFEEFGFDGRRGGRGKP